MYIKPILLDAGNGLLRRLNKKKRTKNGELGSNELYAWEMNMQEHYTDWFREKSELSRIFLNALRIYIPHIKLNISS